MIAGAASVPAVLIVVRELMGEDRARAAAPFLMLIPAAVFWGSGDAACDDNEFPEVAQLRRDILELPCHQSLDDNAIDLVAHAVKQVVAHA